MALFAKKSKSPDAPLALPTAPGASSSNDTSSNDTSNNVASVFDTVDAGDAVAAPTRARKSRVRASSSRVSKGPKGLKGGAVVGLNIGNDSIKAVELRSRGGEIVVTAAGMIATPTESLSNGIVMSPAALSGAIRELFAQSGIRTRNVVTSIAGGGALVVRVLEVPKMSDSELEDNMNMDLERYVPFPPAEVVKDFRALRELPSDPDAPNMEVLLAAAQNETVDLHLKVLQGAKLEAQAIDVEPLAAARAVFYGAEEGNGNSLTPDVATDYNDATALINIGATNTEISVLRGDVLVFTRSVPFAGNALTQAISDHLGLSLPDAERMKREMGDALPPRAPAPDTAIVANTDDWSAFGEDEMAAPAPTTSARINPPAANAAKDGDISAINALANAATNAPAVQNDADPFSFDMFEQGPSDTAPQNVEPRTDEPQEGHRQKQDEPPVERPSAEQSPAGQPSDLPSGGFDLSRFDFSEEEREVDEEIPTDKDVEETSAAAQSSTRLVSDEIAPETEAASEENALPTLEFPMAGEDDDLASMAPSGQMYGVGSVDNPELPSFPSLPPLTSLPAIRSAAATPEPPSVPSGLPPLPSGLMAPGAEGFVDEAEDDLPTVADENAASEVDEDDLSSLPTISSTPISDTTVSGTTVLTPITPGASTVLGAPVFDFSLPSEAGAKPEASGDDFDSAFASMIGAPAIAPPSGIASPNARVETVPGAAPAVATPGTLVSPYSVAPTDAAPTDVASVVSSDFDLDQFATGDGSGDTFGLEDFGLGLDADGEATPVSIHAILQPRLAELVNEVRRSLEYYASRYPDAGVRRIVLVGGGARLANMDALMTQEIGIPTTVQNPLGRVSWQDSKLSPDYVDQNGPAFAVALGLALRDVVL